MCRFYSRPQETKVRVSIVGEYSEGVLKIAVARCSNKDNFHKKKGRMIAEGRLAKNKLFDIIKMQDCSIRKFVEIAKKISQTVANNPEAIYFSGV